jgi:two-component system, chemotaxis family, chemotaxis protein CheY
VQALVVDDSRAVRMMLKRMLSEAGFDSILEAGHGVEALERLGEGPVPDVMLVDWNMPEMNGIDLLRTVRATPEYRAIPVVMVTTETEASQVVRALAAGASDYVMKPFTKDIIVEKLELLGIVAVPGDV